MSNYIVKVHVSDVNRLSNFREVIGLFSESDIATLLDTFQEANINGYCIVKILEKDEKYVLVYSDEDTGFDFFEELNKLNKCDVKINTLNAKLLYGKEKSRGYYSERNSEGMSNNDDIATGFLDSSDMLSGIRMLLHVRTNKRIPIDSNGVIIGRSVSQSEYVVSSPNVSRVHARVYKEGDKCMIMDLGSANGTYVDGVRVLGGARREVSIGSKILLANEVFIIE